MIRDLTVTDFNASLGGSLSATSFTCESAVSLVAPAGFELEVYQIIFSNTSAALIQAGYGGD